MISVRTSTAHFCSPLYPYTQHSAWHRDGEILAEWMSEWRRRKERKISVLGNSKILSGEAKYLQCREVTGEAGNMVGDWPMESCLDLSSAGLWMTGRRSRALLRASPPMAGRWGVCCLWPGWFMVVAMGTERPGGGEAREDGVTIFGTDQMRGWENWRLSSRFLTWVIGRKGHLKVGHVCKSEGGAAFFVALFYFGDGEEK